MSKVAKFNIGDYVVHKNQGYRAIVIDADPLFQASGNYNPQAAKRDFATKNPWYRLLVDGCNQMTYVEECLLIEDNSTEAVDNPNVNAYLNFESGHYIRHEKPH